MRYMAAVVLDEMLQPVDWYVEVYDDGELVTKSASVAAGPFESPAEALEPALEHLRRTWGARTSLF